MRRRLRIGLTVLLLFAAVVFLFNASFWAPPPTGKPVFLAHRAIPQLYSRVGLERDTCTADRIEPPVHDYLENTPRSTSRAIALGADMVEIDIAPTRDDRIAVFHDWTVDCRTEGKGEQRDFTLAELQALDVGHGYTFDSGKTFPFRGKGERISSLEDMLAAAPGTPLIYNFKSKRADEADKLAAALRAAGRDVEGLGDAFYGADDPSARIRSIFPKAWSFGTSEAKACTKAYVLTGWTGHVPNSCRNRTIMVPANYRRLFWGWPNRFFERMQEANTRVVILGPQGSDSGRGFTLPEELDGFPLDLPATYWIDDGWAILPIVKPARDDRTEAEKSAGLHGLERRRARLAAERD